MPILLACSGEAVATEQAPAATAEIPTGATQLRELVAGLDQKMFGAYNAHALSYGH